MDRDRCTCSRDLNSRFSLNTSGELRKLATDAGLSDVRIRFEHRTARYHDLGEFLSRRAAAFAAACGSGLVANDGVAGGAGGDPKSGSWVVA
jgi:hypothetical protein